MEESGGTVCGVAESRTRLGDWATGRVLARAGRLGRRVVVGVKCRLGLLGLNPQRLSR